MPLITRSPLASLVGHPQDVTDRQQPVPFGLCVHTTGSGLPTRAKALGVDPLALAVEFYCAPGANFAHYVLGYDGALLQIADERERARHVGIDPAERTLYLSGAWRERVSKVGLTLWQARWPGKKSPLSLFPSKSANEDYLGVECIPLLARLPNGSLFTPEQYAKLRALKADIEARYGIALTGSRLVGHEDLEPLTRWNSVGGWDPGGLRSRPTFHWSKIS